MPVFIQVLSRDLTFFLLPSLWMSSLSALAIGLPTQSLAWLLARQGLYPLVTSRRASKRANTHRDWSHLALRKPATSRPVDGRYGGHLFSGAMHGRRTIQMLHPAPELLANPSPRIVAPRLGGEVVNYRVGSGGGARAGDVGTITLLKR
jgi:hypothetical protein